jgi:hypothetical protein
MKKGDDDGYEHQGCLTREWWDIRREEIMERRRLARL